MSRSQQSASSASPGERIRDAAVAGRAQFGIVVEALSRLDKDSPDVAGAIPDHGRIIAFRNILIHGYAAVDDRIVWGVIENHLASPRNAVEVQLAKA
ncbi:MAG: DUF86 domain-containing protein [Betaproteobacteria bacterium]|nr:MAG: DUF86 domain-containing protein [Betaproteobacteria bacterium]